MDKKETLEQVIQERDMLHGVVHAFVEEFRVLKNRLDELEGELKQVTVDAEQLELEFPQNKP